MPRKTNGTTTGTTSTRKKKAVSAIAPVMPPSVGNFSETLQTARLEEEIRQRAYELYLERNGSPGDQNQDWLVAEREVLAKHQVSV